jgi:hypothetical protein
MPAEEPPADNEVEVAAVAAAAATQTPAEPSSTASSRRRSSLAVVTIGQHDETRRRAPAVVRQLRLFAAASCVAVLVAPLVVITEPLVALCWRLLPNVRVSSTCEGMLVDELNIRGVVLSVYLSVLSVLFILTIAAETVPRCPRIMPHVLLGAAVGGLYSVCHASWASAGGSLEGLIAPSVVVFPTVYFVSSMSLWSWYFATVRGASCTDAALLTVANTVFATSCTVLATMTTFYVVLTYHVSGLPGVAINGKPT